MRCLEWRLIALATALILLGGCATGLSSACPAVPAYDQAFLDRTIGELDLLPPGSAIETMLADYQVMRAQARACGGK